MRRGRERRRAVAFDRPADGARRSRRAPFFAPDARARARDGRPPAGFAVAGPDRKFVWAEARVEGETVVVRARGVARPAAARYAWADNHEVNLYNGEGLPASPFRTDDWPGVTAGKR